MQRTANPFYIGLNPILCSKYGLEESMVIHWTVNPAPLARLVRSQYNPPHITLWYNGITSVSKTANRGSIPWGVATLLRIGVVVAHRILIPLV